MTLRSPPGRRLRIEIPTTGIRPLEKIRGELAKMAALIKQLRAESTSLEEKRRQAVKADEQEAAQALRAGKPAPASSAPAVDGEIAANAVRLKTAEDALDLIEQDLFETVEHHRGDWTIGLLAELETVSAAQLKALDAFCAARAKRMELAQTALWIQNFPRGKSGSIDLKVPLAGENGEPLSWSEIEAALRADAEPFEIVASEPERD
jgi:hypothetical protein